MLERNSSATQAMNNNPFANSRDNISFRFFFFFVDSLCVRVFECLLLILISFWLVVNFWHPVVMSLKYVKSCLFYLSTAASNILAWDHSITKSQLCLCCILPLACIRLHFHRFYFSSVLIYMMNVVSCTPSYRIHCFAALNSSQCFYFVSVEMLDMFFFSVDASLDFFPYQVPLHNLAVLLGYFHFSKCIRINDVFMNFSWVECVLAHSTVVTIACILHMEIEKFYINANGGNGLTQ